MRATALMLLFLASASPAVAAEAREIAGQRQGDAIVYDAQGFDRVGLATPATVEVRVGPAWSVRATGPAEALANLKIEREGESLRIRPRDEWKKAQGDINRRVRVLITLPRLTGASVAGSGQMMVDQVSGGELRGAVSGSGSIAFGRVAVDALAVSIAGSGTVTAAGTAGKLRVRESGSGTFRAPGLRASDASVAVAGSGSVRAIVSGPAAVSLVGSGSVDLGPQAQCTVKRVGSGRVSCRA